MSEIGHAPSSGRNNPPSAPSLGAKWTCFPSHTALFLVPTYIVAMHCRDTQRRVPSDVCFVYKGEGRLDRDRVLGVSIVVKI